MLYVQHMYLCCIYVVFVYIHIMYAFMYNWMYIYMLYFTIAHSKEVY